MMRSNSVRKKEYNCQVGGVQTYVVNGLLRNLPLSLHGVQVFVHGQDTIVLTDFGLLVNPSGQRVALSTVNAELTIT
uniref:Uncharacterized protein n=1 Tax=Knipowitschia caucasica TaxID=637954 RepID=A0AAV2LGT4_KNICA